VFAACVIDVALVIDCSGSIRDTNPPGVDNWQYVLNFTVDLITSINVGQGATRVGAVSFGRPLYALERLSSLSSVRSKRFLSSRNKSRFLPTGVAYRSAVDVLLTVSLLCESD